MPMALDSCFHVYNAPNIVWWEITYRCNLRCIHCYSSSGRRRAEELTTDEALNLIDQLAQAKVFAIVFGGGEPLLRQDLTQIASYASEKRINTYLTTNGLLVNSKFAREIKNVGFTKVQVSLDGFKPETHDKIRGDGSFHMATQAIRNFIQVGLHTSIRTVAMKLNYKEIPMVLDLAIKLGAKEYAVSNLKPVGRGRRDNIDSLRLSFREYVEVANFLVRSAQVLGKKISIVLDKSFIFLLHPQEGTKGNHIWKTPCIAGISSCGITPDGWVIPCPFMPIKVGNVRRQGFRSIWKDSRILNEIRETLHSRNFQVKGTCRNCFHRYLCGGGCRGIAYTYYGDLLAPDPRCPLVTSVR